MGPFCDPQIVSLSNRRFIPFAFDLSNKGGLFDPTARKAVVAVSPELGGNGVPTPDVLFMTADGKLLARVSNYASEAEFLEVMKHLLDCIVSTNAIGLKFLHEKLNHIRCPKLFLQRFSIQQDFLPFVLVQKQQLKRCKK